MRALLTGILVALSTATASGYDISVGRLGYMEGKVWILKDGAMNWTDGTPNMLIEEGDIIETGRRSRTEIELGMGATLWMNGNTRTEITLLYYDEASISIPFGCIRVKNMQDNRLTVETENASVYIDDDGDARIKVKRDGRVEVYVFEGYATVETDEDIVKVRSGDGIYISLSGRIRERYPDRIDSFDRFCECRVERYRRPYADIGIFIGACDLDFYGTWVTIPAYGYVWRPRVVIGWRPFLCGYWFWDISFGWVWVSYEPWGFLPYHYGHWAWCSSYGWVWVPGRVWSPAWVVWVHNGPYIGWAAAGPDGKPASNSWTYVTRESFYKETSKRPVNYKECLVNHPIYDVKDDIPKERWKDIRPSGPPEPADVGIAVANQKVHNGQRIPVLPAERKAAKKSSHKTGKTGTPVRNDRSVFQTKRELGIKTKGLGRADVSTPKKKTTIKGVKPGERRNLPVTPPRNKKDDEKMIIKPRGKINVKPPARNVSEEHRNNKSKNRKFERTVARR